MKHFIKKITLGSVLTVFSLTSYGGAFFEKDGVAIKGFDTVAYFTSQKALKGNAAFTSEYKGSTFHFVSAANRDLFKANPSQYSPQYDG